MNADARILRPLAFAYARLAETDRNRETLRLHQAVNDLKMVRPVVLIDELPWNEMGHPDELDLRCADPYLREVECGLRRALFLQRHMPADQVLRPYVPVYKVVRTSDIGVRFEEETLATDDANHIVAHRYIDHLETEDDIARLRPPVVTYDRVETMRRYQLVGDILGDLVPVRITGIDMFGVVTWDDISRYRGVTDLLLDLADRPEFSHALVRRLTDFRKSELDQYEALDLLDCDPYLLHCTAARVSDLPGPGFDGTHVTRKNIWGRGTAQIFASVGNAMHDEFDIQYMLETIGQCGLSYYGCCEPLDRKIDFVSRIPNLRKIGVTPWANVDVAAEAIGRKYVVASKPNPAAVAVPVLDKSALRAEIGRILDACYRNGCSVDIVLKDISTCAHRPENLFEWERTVMEMVSSS
jgi:hypothetical protein